LSIASPPTHATTEDAPPPSRLDHLLAVGRREFLAHGYQRTSVEGIGKAAGVSKQTIYRHFSDKSEILRAIVEQASSVFKDTASTLPAARTPLEAVAAAAAPVRRSFLVGEAIALFRLGISLAGQFQELSATLNRQFVASLAPISERMAALARDGAITIDDPLSAAAQLGGMAVEGAHYLMGHVLPPPDSFELHNTAIADLYLNGFTGRAAALPGLDAPWPVDPAIAALHTAARPYFPDAAEFRLSEADLQHLLAVSRRKFFRAGYSETSLDDIGATAHVGRGTLYRWFGAKEGLFKVAMLHAAAEIGAARLPAVKPGAPIEQALADIALALSTALMGRTGTALYRTAIAEANQFPELARTVHDLTRMRAMASITQRLAEHPAGHDLTQGQRDWLATQFVTLSTDGNRYLSIDIKPTPANRRALAQRAARAFLYGHRKLG
jgi:TetR/AcrR family transcriptional repressor of mexJK operon